jgi:hypothetical protein
MAKSFKIPGLGLEIMRNNLKHSNDPYSYEVTNRLLEPKEEGIVQSIISRNYQGQGWRIPDERELRIIAGLAELGVDLGLVSIDHPAYRETINSSTPVGDKFHPNAKLTVYCVKVDPKTHGGNGAKCYFDSSDYSTPTKIRLVRSI